ncbi:MAG: DUF58 domain-containing protein [Thermomicrobiales bacterium]
MEEGKFIHAPVSEPGTAWLWTAALLALLAIVLRQPILLILAVVLGLVAGLARLWWRYGLDAVTYRRQFATTHAFWGEEIGCELIAENTKPLPLVWLEVVDEFPKDLEVIGAELEPSSKVGIALFHAFFSVGPYERVRRRYRLRCCARGYYHFGPATLTTGDLFGFSARQREFAAADHLTVYPRVVPVATFGLPANQPLGDSKALRPLVDDPLRIAGVRPYVPGDNPRRVHWRATARTGALQTKHYERSANPAVGLFLDTNTFEFFWEGTDTALLELSIMATASLVAHLLDEGRAVGLYANAPVRDTGSFDLAQVAPSRNPAQRQRLLEILARFVPGTGVPIERVLHLRLPLLPWGATVVVITGRVTTALQRALLDLARRGHHPVLLSCGARPDLDPALQRRVTAYHLGGKETWDALADLTLAG